MSARLNLKMAKRQAAKARQQLDRVEKEIQQAMLKGDKQKVDQKSIMYASKEAFVKQYEDIVNMLELNADSMEMQKGYETLGQIAQQSQRMDERQKKMEAKTKVTPQEQVSLDSTFPQPFSSHNTDPFHRLSCSPNNSRKIPKRAP